MPRILIHDPRRDRREWFRSLADEGYELVVCSGRVEMFDVLAARRPDAIVFVLSDLALDLGVLWLVRRIAATMPIIVLGESAQLEARRSVQELRPAYYGMFPLEGGERSEVVHDVLRHRSGSALAS